MKKFFKLAAIAAVAMLTVVACKNNKPAEEVIDSTAIETIAEVVKKATTPTVTEAPIDNTSKNVKTVAPSNPTEKVDANADVQKNTDVKRTRR